MNRCLCCNEPRDYEEPVCGNCGADWKTVEALDLDTQLTRYKAQVEKMLAQDPNGAFDVQFRNLRKAFKISYDAHQEIQKNFLASIRAISHLKTFQIEFNHNVQDAFAGQHTLLEFRFTNLSTTNYFGKVRLHWDDDETSDDMDYVAECDDLIAPEQVVLLQETHVFQTPGAKVVKKLEIIVEGTSGEVAKFVASNFQLKIEDPTKTVFNSFTNNTNITARLMSEVDVGANAAAPVVTTDKSPRWEKLSFIWVADETTTSTSASPAAHKNAPATIQETVTVECPACGTPNPPGSVFCSDCGTPLTSRAAAAVSSSAGLPSEEERSNSVSLPSPSDIEVGDLRGAVEQCFEHLRKFSALASSSASKGVFSAVDFSFDLLEQIHDVTPDNELDAIVGMVCEKPAGVEVDDEDFITNFVGKASVVSLMGITVVDNDDPEQLHFQQHLWGDLSTASYGIFRQRFGPNSYIISIGNPSTNESFPGLRFDMRRYKGEESIDGMYEKTSASLAQIFSFCTPKPGDGNGIVESSSALAAQASPEEVLTQAEVPLNHEPDENPPALVKCIHPECGNLNPSDTKFCSECGTNQQQATESTTQTATYEVIHCHACSAQVAAGILYCPECGTAQTSATRAPVVPATEIQAQETPATIKETPVETPPEPEVAEVKTIEAETTQLVTPEPPPESLIDPRQLLIKQRFAERASLLTGFLKQLATVTQLCIEGAPKSVFIDSEVSPELKSILSATVESWANEPIAICLEPHQTECTKDGELLGWSGPASVLSAHGIFHIEQNQNGSYQFEGNNYFLSWEKFFFEFNAGLILREVGPDLWMGTNDKYLIRGTYADYSINVLQWDYFEDFVKQTMLTTLDSFKHSVQHTYD